VFYLNNIVCLTVIITLPFLLAVYFDVSSCLAVEHRKLGKE